MQPIFSDNFLASHLSDFSLSSVPGIRSITTLIGSFLEEVQSGKIRSLKEEEIKTRFINTFFGDALGFNYGNDSRIVRRWNLDPIVKSSESPYLCFGGNPILYSDPKGDDYGITTKKDKNGKITNIKVSAVIYIQGSGASTDEATKLTKGAKDTYKTKTVNGVEVSFDVQYIFNPDKKESDLSAKKGENLLVLDNSTTDRSHVNSFTYQGSAFEYTGNSGVVTKYSGNRTYSTLHESLHLLGLSDRYNKNFPNPDKGYEKDIMGESLSFNLSISHYQNIIDYTKRQHELLTPQSPNLKYLYSNHYLDLKYDRVNGKLKATLKR